ncbi:hypothetical protein [Bacillus sp. P14.5]|uniref:hypothetical protein n=1 Tax=Bacillus sp. P14.5 TaxID=1983400 RepID=UPI0013B05050|nr:hypothetical protein [Bacillus sp. P14.5]
MAFKVPLSIMYNLYCTRVALIAVKRATEKYLIAYKQAPDRGKIRRLVVLR